MKCPEHRADQILVGGPQWIDRGQRLRRADLPSDRDAYVVLTGRWDHPASLYGDYTLAADLTAEQARYRHAREIWRALLILHDWAAR